MYHVFFMHLYSFYNTLGTLIKDFFPPLCFAVMTVQTVYSKKNLKVKNLDRQKTGPSKICPTYQHSHVLQVHWIGAAKGSSSAT